jgi:hypothetical protein
MNNSFTSLSNRYNDILNQYRQTYQNYLSSINDSSNNPLQIVTNYSFFGDGTNHSITSNSAQDCLKSCFSSSKCSGASYFSDSKKCVLGEGKGTLLPSTNNMESAIVFTSLKLSYDLKYLNQQLLDLNKNISDSLEKSNLENQNLHSNKIKKDNYFKSDYSVLLKEREKINKIVLEEELLNSVNNNSQIVVNQNYSYYIVYLLVVLLILFLFIKFFINSSDNSFRQRGGKRKSIAKLFNW